MRDLIDRIIVQKIFPPRSAGQAVLVLILSTLVWGSQATRDEARDFPLTSSQKRIPFSLCAQGQKTRLEIGGLTSAAIYDGNSGETHLRLRDKGGHTLWSDEWVGQSICLGYNAQAHRYIAGATRQEGAAIVLTDLWYIAESSPHAQETSVTGRTDPLRAFVTVASPDKGYVALINEDGMLWVLDVVKDQLVNLGAAPLPPPLKPDERRNLPKDSSILSDPWSWSIPATFDFMTLDNHILWFENAHLLKASYGADSASARAVQRTEKIWDLMNLSRAKR